MPLALTHIITGRVSCLRVWGTSLGIRSLLVIPCARGRLRQDSGWSRDFGDIKRLLE